MNRRLYACAAIALAAAGSAARGQTWTGGTGSWSDPTMWSTGTVPAANATVRVDNATGVNSVVDAAAGTAYLTSLTIDAGDTVRGTGIKVKNLTLNGTLETYGATGSVQIDNPISGIGTINFGATTNTLATSLAAPTFPAGMTVSGPFSTSGSDLVAFGNFGTILLDGAGKKITIGPTSSFSLNSSVATNFNAGLIQVSNGATVELNNFQNDATGTITASGGSTVKLSAKMNSSTSFIANKGTINLDNSALFIGTEPFASTSKMGITTANLGTIHRTGASTVYVFTGVNNAGATLSLDDFTGPWELYGGILGGNLTTTTSAPLIARGSSVLQSVVIGGHVEVYGSMACNDVTFTSGSTVHLNGGGLGTYGVAWFDLQQDARITGSGTIGMSSNPVSVMAGTISPGDSLGTINARGNFASAPGFHLAMELGAPGASDHFNLNVNGTTLNLSAADDYLDLSSLAGALPNTPYTIATATSVVGTFDHVTPGYAVQYTPTSIIVTPLPEPAALAGFALIGASGLLRRRRP